MAEWTAEERAEVIAKYQEANPTPETSAEIVHALAEEYEKTDNGVRMILNKADVYVKKNPSNSGTKSESKGTRVNKAEALDELTNLIDSQGCEVDDAIISKLTGKAAVYFTGVLNKIIEAD